MLFILLFISNVFASTFSATVVKVIDGDTVDVISKEGIPVRIRMEAIDAPERTQSYGKESKETLQELLLNKEVSVSFSDKDFYGRLIGTIFLKDVDVNLMMIQIGLAWFFDEYSNNEKYALSQKEAQKKKLGLWVDSECIPPWEFRKLKKTEK